MLYIKQGLYLLQYRQPPSQNIQEHFNSRKAAFFHVKMRALFAIAVFYSELALALAGVLFRVMFCRNKPEQNG